MSDSPDLAPVVTRPPGPSTRLALIVVGIAAFLLILGTVGAALTSNQSQPTPAPRHIVKAAGAGLNPVSARAMLAPIASDGSPPDNILNAVVLPAGSAVVAGSAVNEGVSLYDQSLRFVIPASQQAVITFLRAEMPAEHWQMIDRGSARSGGGIEVIGEHPGSDGNEWELGLIVSPTVFSSTSSANTTPVQLRLFVESDDS
jgi:hypothetical protein